MARYVFKLPDVGEGTAEAEIAAWRVAPGDMIAEDDPLVDVMTDKATVEIPSPVSGRVVALHGSPGERRAVGSELVVFEIAGDDSDAAAEADREEEAPAAAPPPAEPAKTPPAPEPRATPLPDTEKHPAAPPFPVATATRKPLASPAVRRRAWEAGVALQFVPGSGPAGRVTQADLDAYAAAGRHTPRAAAPAEDRIEEIKITGLRRVIAERLQEAKRRIPHFAYIEEIDVTALEELRGQLNADKPDAAPRLTLLPFLMRALVRALAAHPQINARFDDAAGILHRHAAVHIGIATQTAGGLVVPVVRHAERLDLWEAAVAIARLSEAARNGRAARADLAGSTITITSLGALGGLATTPVINHPEVAIVGVNRIIERPVVRDGRIVIRRMMNLSSSFDHRIVDGWEAATFVQRVRGLIEQPALLFVDPPR